MGLEYMNYFEVLQTVSLQMILSLNERNYQLMNEYQVLSGKLTHTVEYP